jgi:hypothetical protein
MLAPMHKHRLRALLAALALALGLTPAVPARADMMTVCAPEIGQFCADVSRGRGRIAACLVGRSNAISANCLAEVRAAARGPLVPGQARRIFDPSLRATLPQSCAAAAASLCPGVPLGDGRIFACLYARSDRASQTCNNEAQAALRQAR